MNAAVHLRFDQRTDVFVLDRPLVLTETVLVDAIRHGLILEVAFSALVADRTVERMVDEQEFHHAFPRFLHRLVRVKSSGGSPFGPGPEIIDRHGAGSLGLRHAFDLDQAHAAIAGNRQAARDSRTAASPRPPSRRPASRVEPVGDLDFRAVDFQVSACRWIPSSRRDWQSAWPYSAGHGAFRIGIGGILIDSLFDLRSGNVESGPAPAMRQHRPARRSCGLRSGRRRRAACRSRASRPSPAHPFENPPHPARCPLGRECTGRRNSCL